MVIRPSPPHDPDSDCNRAHHRNRDPDPPAAGQKHGDHFHGTHGASSPQDDRAAGGTVAVPDGTLTISTAVLLRRATCAAMDWRLTPCLWRRVSTMAPIMATSRIRPAASK